MPPPLFVPLSLSRLRLCRSHPSSNNSLLRFPYSPNRLKKRGPHGCRTESNSSVCATGLKPLSSARAPSVLPHLMLPSAAPQAELKAVTRSWLAGSALAPASHAAQLHLAPTCASPSSPSSAFSLFYLWLLSAEMMMNQLFRHVLPDGAPRQPHHASPVRSECHPVPSQGHLTMSRGVDARPV